MTYNLPLEISFPPIADNNSNLLILGSMPSVKSLQQQQYYAHPRNTFWRIISVLFNIEKELNYNVRCQQLIHHQIAVWDVVKACQRKGSLDQNIDTSSLIINDFNHFLRQHPKIKKIVFNGTKAEQIFNRYVLPTLSEQQTKVIRVRLPSTSPANAAIPFEQKLQQWQQILSVRQKLMSLQSK